MAKKQRTRKNTSQINSVSVSPEFNSLLKEHDLSPTEVFRVGMAVTLCELGIRPYNVSKLNHKRSKLAKEFLQEYNKLKELSTITKKIADFEKIISEVQE